jgi:hypothetical protein
MDTGDAVNMFIGQAAGQIAAVTRIGSDLYRLYFFHHIDAIPSRLSGDRDVGAAFGYLRDAGVAGEWLVDAQPQGPLATFDGAHRWGERPYRDGVVLVGDAAGASDPSWGSGLSLARGASVISQSGCNEPRGGQRIFHALGYRHR